MGRLQEVNPSTFLVNVSATVPLGMAPGGGGGGSGGGGGEGAAGSPEDLDADDIIGRLVGNPDGSFPRTKEATGGSVQVGGMRALVAGTGACCKAPNAVAVWWWHWAEVPTAMVKLPCTCTGLLAY